MELHIKNMVCDRCIMVVQQDVEQAGLTINTIALGSVVVNEKELTAAQQQQLQEQLELHGFELLKTEAEILSDKIKTELLLYIERGDMATEKLSAYLSDKLHKDYGLLSKHFSAFNGITIEKYFIKLKLEKAKQLVLEGVLNFSEIAATLGYNTLSHLSAQFKKETGLSLSAFKEQPHTVRNGFEKIL